MKKEVLTFSPLSETELRKLLSEQNQEEQAVSEPESSRKPAGKKKHRKLLAAICACAVLIAGGTAGFYITQKNHDTVTSEETTDSTEESVAETMPNEFRCAVTGDIVNFGAYEWYVIDISDNSYTLLCKDIVCERAYHNKYENITWKNSTLRNWLNDTFYNKFSDEEKEKIINTSDNIRLLTVSEATNLNHEIRSCDSAWWLLQSKDFIYCTKVVSSDGYVSAFAERYMTNIYGVRPVVTLKLN